MLNVSRTKGARTWQKKTAVVGFLAHYHAERNHQRLDNRLIEPGEEVGSTAGEVACRERLGGMLRYYYRLFRFRNKRHYSEFLPMPSKPSKAATHKTFLFKYSA